MSTSRNAHIGLALTILAIGMLMSLLLFTRASPILAATRIEKKLDALAAYTASYVWVTLYDDEGGYTDVTYVPFGTDPVTGYGTKLSSLVEHVVDTTNNSYVLNWRPNVLGSNLQLCGLRVAYRLPLAGGGFSSTFSYVHVAGSVLRPRNSTSEWGYSGGGCIYLTAGVPYYILNTHLNIPNGSRIDYLRVYYYRRFYFVYLPLTMRDF